MIRFGDNRMKRLVLDTSAYSHMRTGHAALLDLLAAAEALLIPVTVLGELEGAFEIGSRAKANRHSLTEFLSEPFVFVLDTTPDVARHYGQIYARQRRSGRPIPVNDMWIAALVLQHRLTLYARDRHFDHRRLSCCAIMARRLAGG